MGARARIIVAVVTAASFASAASAQCVGSCTTGVVYAPGDGAPNVAQLQIPVTATVAAPCGFATAPSGTHNEPNFDDHAWQHDFGFVINCSIASRVAVVSANGALKAPGSAPPGYTTLAPYDVTLNVTQNVGGPATGTCAVANLTTGGSCTFRGPAAPGQGLAVAVSQNQAGSYIRVSAPVYAGASVLVADNGYTDTLTVTLSPAT
jgi:hypothetical protein